MNKEKQLCECKEPYRVEGAGDTCFNANCGLPIAPKSHEVTDEQLDAALKTVEKEVGHAVRRLRSEDLKAVENGGIPSSGAWEEEFDKRLGEYVFPAKENGTGSCLREVPFISNEIKSFIHKTLATEREEVIKRAIEGLPEKDDGINPHTKMPNYLEYNKGTTDGWNDCLKAVRAGLEKLRGGK